MKTLKFAALAAVGLALPALAGSSGIQSANIVGYQTQSLDDEFTMFGVPFKHVNEKPGEETGLKLNQDLTFTNATASEFPALADQIWIWDASKAIYDKFFNYSDGEGGFTDGWCYMFGGQDLFEEIEKYKNGLADSATLYYKNRNKVSKKVTGAGAVESSKTVEYVIAGGNFTMLSNPYPVVTKLNDADNSVEFGGVAAGDQIWIWVNSEYVVIERDGNKWDVPAEYADGLPSGTAFFYYAKAGADRNVIFKNPIQ